MHLEVIKLLQVRLEKTLYNRAEDQVMVWAYLRGISDAAIKNKKEGHFVNVTFTPSIPTSFSEAVKESKQPPAKTKPPIRTTKNNTLEKAREVAAKKVKSNVASRLRTLKKK